MTIYSEDGGWLSRNDPLLRGPGWLSRNNLLLRRWGGCQGMTLYSGECLLTKSGNRVVVKERPFALRSFKNSPKLRCGFVCFVFLCPHERAGRGE